MMRFCVLASGSSGNATYVASGDTAILIDAGLSGIEIERRLAAIGVDFSTIGAILVTHEHSDHIRGVAVLSRRGKIPVFANPATLAGAGSALDKLHACLEFDTGVPFEFQDLQVHPFAVSHDTADPVGFVISDGCCTLGQCTDTGTVTRLMRHRLAGCNALVLESNHDPELLKNGPYPPFLKQRVRSNQGHLANSEAAEFLGELVHERLEHVVLAHLSETNNLPALAYETAISRLADTLPAPKVSVASQHRPAELVVLTSR
jgi:phosphoribosyl 1,2-cyclic phosphodiesterase